MRKGEQGTRRGMVPQDSPPAALEGRSRLRGEATASQEHGDENGEELLLRVASKGRVLNEFLIGQELYGNWFGSYQSSGPMRNSFNVFVGVRKRQGRGKR